MKKPPRGAPRASGAPRRQKRALSNVGGVVTLRGDASLEEVLRAALEVRSAGTEEAERETRAHVHGFHPYPARMHPRTARGLVEAFTRPGERVLDPFCGSGTVLVESCLVGRAALGRDLNPLAVLLAARKTTPASAEEVSTLVEAARRVALGAEERRVARAGATRVYPPEDVALFDAHVLLELDGLLGGIEAIDDPDLQRDLSLVLSAMLVKVSRRTSDTDERLIEKRIASGFTVRFFFDKAEELGRALSTYASLLPPGPRADVAPGDATLLRGIAAESVDAIVTSPPYPGVYDYFDHHALRFRWLGLDAESFARGELGARRKLRELDGRGAREAFGDALGATLRASARVLRRGGVAALWIGDAAVSGEPIETDRLLEAIAPRAGFSVRAIASQARPNFHGGSRSGYARAPKSEHVVVLEKR